MRTFAQLTVGPLILILAVSTPVAAQERHAVSSAELGQAVANRAAEQEADRAAIRSMLARSEIRDVAAKAGIDLDRVAAAVNGLSADSLAEAAAAARSLNQTYVGGASTITVSTTTVILVLLVVILLLVAAD